MLKKGFSHIIAIGFTLNSAIAFAQFGGMYNYNYFSGPANSYFNNLNASYNDPNLPHNKPSDLKNNPRQQYNSSSAVTNSSLTYTPSSSRTRANLQNFVNKSRKSDPQGAVKMEQLFASTDIITEIDRGMREIGLNKNNTADAYALYWINAWEASRGRITPTSPAKAKAVAAQAARGMAFSAEYSSATEAQKQEMAEALIIQAVMIEGYIEAAAGDPQQLKAIANAVRQGAKASGLDLDAMTLTEQGFVKATGKKRSDATEALPGSSDGTQLASASAAKGGTDEGSGSGLLPGVLIAGLAGSTLAAAFLYGKNKGVKKGNG
jgi:hypothetical protein